MALALCSLGAAAQSVTVVMENGLSHKFGADYVQSMTFEQVSQGSDLKVNSLGTDVYSGGNATLTFDLSDGGKLVCDLYGPADTQYLRPGEYVVTNTNQGNRVDISSYSYYEKEGARTALASGSLTVSNEQKVYTIDVNITLADGQEVKTRWSGTLPSATYSEYFDLVLDKAKYNENPQAPGTFYISFSDPDYYIEMPLIFFSGADATTLMPGTYIVGGTGDMTVAGGVVSMYRPSSNPAITEGIVTVEKNGDKYVMDMNLLFDDGRRPHFTLDAEITGTPTFTGTSSAPALKRPAGGIRSINLK